MTTSFPLAWPDGWPRTPPSAVKDGRYQFKRREGIWTFAAARDALYEELARLGSPPRLTVLSSNFELNQRGEPSKARGMPTDQAIAVYFQIRNRPLVMACDRFERAEENMRSVALAVDAMRAIERHGGGVMMDRAFAGFAALPAPEPARSWRDVLGLPGAVRRQDVEFVFKTLAKKMHPDAGGSAAKMTELNAARAAALKEIGA